MFYPSNILNLRTHGLSVGLRLCLALPLAVAACSWNWQTLGAQEPNTSANASSQKLVMPSVKEDEKTIRIESGNRSILVYNKVSPPAPEGIEAVYERSGFVHPVTSPGGQVVTTAFPADHAHQHGIFLAWVKTTYRGQSVDFWNLAGRTGRVLHEKVVSVSPDLATFEVDLLHRVLSDPPVDVVRERWKVQAMPTDGSYYQFDIETTQQSITDDPLLIEKYHYGGMAVRGPMCWLLQKDSGAKLGGVLEDNAMINSFGQDRIAGNHAHARWVAMSGKIQGKDAGIIVLDHPNNFRAPQASRLHPTKPYFCFAPCVDEAFTIDRDHPYHARYRFLVVDRAADAAWIETRWNEFR